MTRKRTRLVTFRLGKSSYAPRRSEVSSNPLTTCPTVVSRSVFGPLGEQVGAAVSLESPRRADTLLFSEGQSRILVSVAPKAATLFEELAEAYGIAASRIGVTGGDELKMKVNGVDVVAVNVDGIRESWSSAIERAVCA